MIKEKPIVLFLMGPTACGKSKLAIDLREHLPIELISVDSALIYRSMNIGTDKPHATDLLNHPHRLINIKDPTESYSVIEFQNDVLKEIKNIINLNKIPCLVGGTMFYYNVLLHGLSILPSSDIKIRECLLEKRNNKNCLHEELKLIDPVSAYRIHKNDHQRLLRALEIFYISGKSLTELKHNYNYIFPYKAIQFSIIPINKEWLNNRIEFRVKKMLLSGFQEEVESLFLRGDLHINLQSMRCIGYRQMWEYLQYKNNYREMLEKIIYATRRLAKNQLTWLKKWKNVNKILYNSDSRILIYKILNVLKINMNNDYY